MEYILGEYHVLASHKGCNHGVDIMKIEPLKINGQRFPKNAPDKWYWCNGKVWDGSNKVWHRCGASSIKGTLNIIGFDKESR